MNREKALNILGLKEGFTTEELKKAYRRLSGLHHPDNYMQESNDVRFYHEEKMKEINGAHDFLIEKLKGENSSSYGSLIIDLLSYDENREDYYQIDYTSLRKIKEELILEYSSLFYDNNRLEKFKNLYIKKLCQLKEDFYNWFYIIESEVKDELDCSCLGKFYDCLVDIRKKYGKLDIIINRINEAAQIDENNEIHVLAKEHIERVKGFCLINIRNSKYARIDYFIDGMKIRIGEILREFEKINYFYNRFIELFGPDIFSDVMNYQENSYELRSKYNLNRREIYLIYDLNLIRNNEKMYKYIPDVLDDATSYFEKLDMNKSIVRK